MDVDDAYDIWRASEGQAKVEALDGVYMAAKQLAEKSIGYLKDQVPELADEIAADVVMGIEGFRADAKFSTWVTRIMRNKRADHIESAKIDRDRFVKLPQTFGGNGDSEDSWYERTAPQHGVGDMEREMESHLQLLEVEPLVSPEDRELFEAVFVEGMTHPEAAEVLGKTPDAVESAVRRLRVKLRGQLRKVA